MNRITKKLYQATLLIFFMGLVACADNGSDDYVANNEISLHGAVQLNADERVIIEPFNPLVSSSYHLKHFFVADAEDGESYLMWAYFVKEAAYVWRVYVTYDNRDVSSYKLVFATSGKLDFAKTEQANKMNHAMPLTYDISVEERDLLLLLDLSTSTQYSFVTAVYYIVAAGNVPYTNRAEPVATSLVSAVVNVDAGETPPVNQPFIYNDPLSYNNSVSFYVFDSLGMQHTMYLYFIKVSNNLWDVYPLLEDSSESLPGDGWAELLSGGEKHSLMFDGEGGISTVNDLFVLEQDAMPLLSWSLESGAEGLGAGGFSIFMDFSGISQHVMAFSITGVVQDGGW